MADELHHRCLSRASEPNPMRSAVLRSVSTMDRTGDYEPIEANPMQRQCHVTFKTGALTPGALNHVVPSRRSDWLEWLVAYIAIYRKVKLPPNSALTGGKRKQNKKTSYICG